MIRKIKRYFKQREFEKRCLYVPCSVCPYFFNDGYSSKCRLESSLGLDEQPMKYKLFRKDFEIWKHDIVILPTVRIHINSTIYREKNFSVEFHFLTLHTRLLWLREER